MLKYTDSTSNLNSKIVYNFQPVRKPKKKKKITALTISRKPAAKLKTKATTTAIMVLKKRS